MRESRSAYRISNLSADELNFILQLIADRFDELEGRRGTPMFKSNVNMDSNRITTLGSATTGSDALRQDQADEDTTSLQGQITSHVNNVSNPHTVTLEQARTAGGTFSGTVQFLDSDGAVIHEIK